MTQNTEVAAHLVIRGRVQGVGYRYFAEERANALGLKGWVRNTSNGMVEAEAEGPRDMVEQWIEQMRQGCQMAHIESISIDWRHPTHLHHLFSIIS